jgi:cytosine/uracil/thiamine/allantoin permease
MKSILILAIVGCIFVYAVQTMRADKATVYLLNNIDNHWTQFKQAHNRKYHNSTHERKRYLFIIKYLSNLVYYINNLFKLENRYLHLI